jgi:hypothetical protein
MVPVDGLVLACCIVGAGVIAGLGVICSGGEAEPGVVCSGDEAEPGVGCSWDKAGPGVICSGVEDISSYGAHPTNSKDAKVNTAITIIRFLFISVPSSLIKYVCAVYYI